MTRRRRQRGEVTANDIDPYPQMWAPPELVEAVHESANDVARSALDRLAEMTGRPVQLGLGTEARSRALLSDGENADLLYREAVSSSADQATSRAARARCSMGVATTRRSPERRASSFGAAHHMFVAMEWRRLRSAPAASWSRR